MGMIPGMSVLERTELVSERVPFRDRTLCNAVDTIHLHGVELAYAMPVDGCPILIIVVLDVDFQLVAPASFDQRPGELLVEDLSAGFSEPIRSELTTIWLVNGRLSIMRVHVHTYEEISIDLEPVLSSRQPVVRP